MLRSAGRRTPRWLPTAASGEAPPTGRITPFLRTVRHRPVRPARVAPVASRCSIREFFCSIREFFYQFNSTPRLRLLSHNFWGHLPNRELARSTPPPDGPVLDIRGNPRRAATAICPSTATALKSTSVSPPSSCLHAPRIVPTGMLSSVDLTLAPSPSRSREHSIKPPCA